MRWMRSVSPVMTGALMGSLLGCSTTSTIYRRSAPQAEAHILGGSPTSIAVNAHGEQVIIAREDIAEVDYPGNVHALIGGIILGVSALNVTFGQDDCFHGGYTGADRASACLGVLGPAAVGAGMLIWGLVTNLSAKDAFNDTSQSLPPPTPTWGHTPGYAPGPYPPGYAPGYPAPGYPPPSYQPAPYPPAYPPGSYPPPGYQTAPPPPVAPPSPAPAPGSSTSPPYPPPGPAPSSPPTPLPPEPVPTTTASPAAPTAPPQ